MQNWYFQHFVPEGYIPSILTIASSINIADLSGPLTKQNGLNLLWCYISHPILLSPMNLASNFSFSQKLMDNCSRCGQKYQQDFLEKVKKIWREKSSCNDGKEKDHIIKMLIMKYFSIGISLRSYWIASFVSERKLTIVNIYHVVVRSHKVVW